MKVIRSLVFCLLIVDNNCCSVLETDLKAAIRGLVGSGEGGGV